MLAIRSQLSRLSTFLLVSICCAGLGQAQSLTTLVNFTNDNSGLTPSGLIQGKDGNFYGVTGSGGLGYGTVFKMTPSGSLTALHFFGGGANDDDGQHPVAPLLQGIDGNFYGTTSGGGTKNYGTVFKITPGGALTTLYAFDKDLGSDPLTALVQDSAGNFYGTTLDGGPLRNGTVFRLTPDGSLTNLVVFNGTNGGNPNGLISGGDGNFYGTTNIGGASGLGTVFRITPDGTLTTLWSFSETGAIGSRPLGGLLLGNDGNFYGTNSAGGDGQEGTIFQLTPNGLVQLLAGFTYVSGGRNPGASLVQGKDGNFYGSTGAGGTSDNGTLFKYTPGGGITTLVNFNGPNGQGPQAALVQATDGNFYGTTIKGGTYQGTAFKLLASDSTPSIIVAGTVAFSDVPVNTTQTGTFEITNTGGVPITISGISYPAGFTGNFSSGSIAAGAVQTVTVTFAPTSAIGYSGNITVTSNAGSGTSILPVSGTGIGASSSDPFDGALLGGGYYYSSWFGIYNSQFYPWDYRTDIGFFYVDPVGTDLYLYVVNGNNGGSMGWLYTNSTIFPNVYCFSENTFLYFFTGSTSFANYTTGKIETY